MKNSKASARKFLILPGVMTLFFLSSDPHPAWAKTKKRDFIRYDVWLKLSPAEKKDLKKKLDAIPSLQKKSSSPKSPSRTSSLQGHPILLGLAQSFDWAGAYLINEVKADDSWEVKRERIQKEEYDYEKTKWKQKCNQPLNSVPLERYQEQTSRCNELDQSMRSYEVRHGRSDYQQRNNRDLTSLALPPYPSGDTKKTSTQTNSQTSSRTSSSKKIANNDESEKKNELQQNLEHEEKDRELADSAPKTESPPEEIAPQAPSDQTSSQKSPSQGSTMDAPPLADTSSGPTDDERVAFAKQGHNESGRNTKENLKGDRDAAGVNYIRENQAKGDCQISSAFGERYDCKGTKALLKGYDTTVGAANIISQVGAQAIGAQSAYEAQKSGSLAGSMTAAAGMQATAAKTQLTLGAMSAVIGGLETFYHARKYSNNEDRFKEEMVNYSGERLADGGSESGISATQRLKQYKENTEISKYSEADIKAMSKSTGREAGDHGYLTSQSDGSLAATMINNEENRFGDLNERTRGINDVSWGQVYLTRKKQLEALPAGTPQYLAQQRMVQEAQTMANQQLMERSNDYERKVKEAKALVRTVGAQAADEQIAVADQAKGQGINHLMQGASQMIQGYAGLKAAELNKKSAKSLAAVSPFNFAPPANPAPPINPGDALSPAGSTAISPGSGSSDSSGAEGNSDSQKDGISLGDPVTYQPESNQLANAAPPAPNFKPESGGSGGGGGGSGGGGGGSTPPSSGGGEDNPAPRLGDSRNVPAYESGGAYRGGGGSGGGKDGPDLSGLLAQFLPKQGEEAGTKNGILDYGGKRSPASEEEERSLLDRSVNIFERIHQAYQDKQKKRRIGI